MNGILSVNSTSLNQNAEHCKHELYTTVNKIQAESKVFSMILEEIIKRGGNANVQS